jgi:ankyrin repeat protein
VPPRGLPGNANLEQLKKGAKSFQRAVRAGDGGAATVVREFHPRMSDAQPGSPELARFTRADAQLVIARQFAFQSWPKLKAHLDLVARYTRSPHEQPVGGPLADERAIVDEFLRLACLNYGDDDPDRLRRAQSLLEQHDWLARASIHTIAATGEVDAARMLLDRDPAHASLVGGPYAWEPLLYLAYSRAGAGPGRSAIDVARLLLEHGADPNAGYLWEGLVPAFTAVTGALGGGGTLPEHPARLPFARLLLESGADANDGQALYNQAGDAREDWVELLLEYGLGTGDGGPWRRRLGERQESPRQMVEDLLMAAAGHGFSARVRTLLSRGVDPDGRGSRHPIYEGRAPVQEAALTGHLEIVSLLVEAGATWEHDEVDALLAAATGGDGGVALLIELGFDVNAGERTRPLHEAAMRGDLQVIRLLLEHGGQRHSGGRDADRRRRIHRRLTRSVRRARRAALGRGRLAWTARRRRPGCALSRPRAGACGEAERVAGRPADLGQRLRRGGRPRARARAPDRRQRGERGALHGRRGPRRPDHSPECLCDRTRGPRRPASPGRPHRRLTQGAEGQRSPEGRAGSGGRERAVGDQPRQDVSLRALAAR